MRLSFIFVHEETERGSFNAGAVRIFLVPISGIIYAQRHLSIV